MLPMVRALAALVLGLVAGLRWGGPSAALALAATAVVLIAALRGGRAGARGRGSMLVFAVLFLGGWALGARARADTALDCRARWPDGARLRMRVVLAANLAAGAAVPSAASPLRPGRIIAVRGAPLRACGNEVRFLPPATLAGARAGAVLEVAGTWRAAPVRTSAWPADPLYAGYLAAASARLIAAPSWLDHPLLTARGAAEARLARLFGPRSPLADALLLGRREALDPAITRRFTDSGLIHLLAISGAHVALIGAAVFLLLIALRRSRRTATLVTLAVLALYLAIIGAPPSAARAGIMLALVLVARLVQRPSAPAAIIAATAFALLAWDPLNLLDAGFQLSFAGALAITLLRPALLALAPRRWHRHAWFRYGLDPLATSFAAFVATAPIAAAQFGRVAPVSLLANLPAVPLTSLALLGVSAALVLDPLAPPLARLVADGAGVALDLLLWVADRAAATPWGHQLVAPPRWTWWALAAALALIAADLAAKSRPRVRWAVASTVVVAVFVLLPLLAPIGEGALEIAVLDVGQGDAIALRTPKGRWLLIDAGPRDARSDAGERRVVPFLLAQGARRLEAMVLTHPHADHIGGAPAVLRTLPVARLIDPGAAVASPFYEETLAAARARDVRYLRARQGAVLRLDGLELTFLWPDGRLLDADANPNEISAVILLRYGAFSALLAGDAEAPAEQAMLRRYGTRLRATLLKAGHHGSATSSTPAWMHAVRPSEVVISVGRRNRYGHPTPSVLNEYRDDRLPVLRTDRDGTVRIRATADGRWARVVP